jgi:hypothetical protein
MANEWGGGRRVAANVALADLADARREGMAEIEGESVASATVGIVRVCVVDSGGGSEAVGVLGR